jgi:hypothetical protein
MTTNPYEHFVGKLDPVAVIAETAPRLAAVLQTLGPERCELPAAEGKWSPREVTAHLADCELMHGVRMREALAEDTPVVHPFDQDAWARRYAAYDLASGLATFSALRVWNLRLIRSLSAADRERNLTHPERGTLTVEVLIRTMAGHDRNHLLALEQLAQSAG